ncbi:UNVERIFIED_CONTAM: hypothetical protein PYX00_011080 [Menopon gallinae]|uniref:phosphoglucomutase (alpha-D-glucose-1,6-bisphosphate-dependent) n=1 Tax=Menopon gallinae TaxID=328185 RepID=A0AAW2H5Q6_9NEOP
MSLNIETVKTKPYLNQEFGTSGVRKSVKVFKQENYLNNLLWAIFTVGDFKNKTIVLGGDGRYFNKEAILTALKMLIACNAKKVYIAKNGWLSTPAISIVIKKYKLDYGIIFSASHNPAGEEGDFGVKVNSSNGSGINKKLCSQIYEYTKKITSYDIVQNVNFNIDTIQKNKFLNTEVEVIDSVYDYTSLMEHIFDFNKIKDLFKQNFTMKYEGYNAITGIYAKDIFFNKLNVPLESLNNIQSLEDFGKHHADPNSLYAKHLIDLSKSANSPDIIFASDGDGDRNLIIGKNVVVSPCDSLAILLKYAHFIPYYKQMGIKGVARSMPTSRAVDVVAKALNINCYEVPTGWRFFGSLLENNLITFCGEESYGTGSIHCGEKDGLWAMLFWLNIIAELKLPVKEVVENLWKTYGRYYFSRLDYFNITQEIKENIFNNFISLNNQQYLEKQVFVTEFVYTDNFLKEVINTKAYIMQIGKDIRLILRASGTDTSNITLRLYVEKYQSDTSNIFEESSVYIKDLLPLINKITLNIKPNIID